MKWVGEDMGFKAQSHESPHTKLQLARPSLAQGCHLVPELAETPEREAQIFFHPASSSWAFVAVAGSRGGPLKGPQLCAGSMWLCQV